MIERNVLITGASGFVGSSLKELLEPKLVQSSSHFILHTPSSSELDLTDFKSVKNYFNKQNVPFESIIHCASKVAKSWDNQKSFILRDNLMMFENLISVLEDNPTNFTKLINLSSGAVFDKRDSITSSTRGSAMPSDLAYPVPKDYYGLSKAIIEKRAELIWYCGTLRIFGLFGPKEEDTRFIKNNIKRYIEHLPIEINQDCKYNYFSIYDLAEIIFNMITSNSSDSLYDFFEGRITNIGYEDYTTLTDLANIINSLDSYKVPVKVTKPGWNNSYYSDNSILKILSSERGIKLLGLRNSIERMFKEIKNE